ncbi:hypothetical protein J6590_092892 [Homalodisca vitripennis]|nr:hypothetical protein J6590_092892 [Homalodisca vitripennis]
MAREVLLGSKMFSYKVRERKYYHACQLDNPRWFLNVAHSINGSVDTTEYARTLKKDHGFESRGGPIMYFVLKKNQCTSKLEARIADAEA